MIENWRPISLLNIDYKIISKLLAIRMKYVLPDLISRQQTAYKKERFIGEGGKLISDIIEVCDTFNFEGFLVSMDMEKAFDSLNHNFYSGKCSRAGISSNMKVHQDLGATLLKPSILSGPDFR